jgi:hypothetical protein
MAGGLKLLSPSVICCPGQAHHAPSAQQNAGVTPTKPWEIVMKKITYAAVGAALIALSVANAASASERHHARRHVQQQSVSTNADPRNAFDSYYPGWGRDPVPTYGVYPGLIYGGATSAPAGR